MAVQWKRIKTAYLGGMSYDELEKRYKLSRKTIQNRASKEGWKKEKVKIKEEVAEKMRERIVRARCEQLEKLVQANEAMIDGLVAMAEAIKENPQQNFFDEGRTLRNAESMTRAIQTAMQTQRDLYRLPTMDQEQRRIEFEAKKQLELAKLILDADKWDQAKAEKAQESQTEGSQTVWKIEEPEDEGGAVDG